MALRPAREDGAPLDWRPGVRAVLSAWDAGRRRWEVVPTDGTEPLRSRDGHHHDDHGESVPLVVPDGSVFATLRTWPAIDRSSGQLDTVVEALQSLLTAHHVAQRARQRAQAAETLALTDALTGLPNRRAWRRALSVEDARTRRTHSITLLAVVDLDGLKQLNDRQGHLAGDVLLRLAASTLRAAIRAEDTLARTGGDEFCIMAVDYKPPIPDALSGRLRRGLEGAGIDASLGAVVRHPDETLAEAANRADRAMYDDKARRKSRER